MSGVAAGQSPYRALLSTVDGPAVWGEPVLNRLQVRTGGDPAASLDCVVRLGEREVWQGTTDSWGCAVFESTWAAGDRPMVAVAGWPAQPTDLPLLPPGGQVRLRHAPAAFSGDTLTIELRGAGHGPIAVALHAGGSVRSAVVAELQDGEATVALPTPAGLAGVATIVARTLSGPAVEPTSRSLLLLPRESPTAAGAQAPTLLVGAAPTPAAGEPVRWPLALAAAGLRDPLERHWREPLLRLAAAGHVDAAGSAALSDCYGLPPDRATTESVFRADAGELAAQQAVQRVAELQRWYRPAGWTQLAVLLTALVLSLAAHGSRLARVVAIVLPLGAAAALAAFGWPRGWPAVAGLAALALVACDSGTWSPWVLLAIAAGLTAWGAGLADGTAALLAAAACGLAGSAAVLRQVAVNRPGHAVAGHWWPWPGCMASPC